MSVVSCRSHFDQSRKLSGKQRLARQRPHYAYNLNENSHLAAEVMWIEISILCTSFFQSSPCFIFNKRKYLPPTTLFVPPFNQCRCLRLYLSINRHLHSLDTTVLRHDAGTFVVVSNLLQLTGFPACIRDRVGDHDYTPYLFSSAPSSFFDIAFFLLLGSSDRGSYVLFLPYFLSCSSMRLGTHLQA